MTRRELFLTGMRLSLPISIGYLIVATAMGMWWTQHGFAPLWSGFAAGLTMSSTGMFAGVTLMAQKSGALEIIATTLLVNSRYLLMALSMSLKLPENTALWKRFLVAFGVSDELFALHSPKPLIVFSFFTGSMVLPVVGWSVGTWVGAYAGEVIPPNLQTIANFILFSMFVAIVVPPARESRPILLTLLLSGGISLFLWWAPLTAGIEFGWRLIITAVLASATLAFFFPEGAVSPSSKIGSKRFGKAKAVLNGIRRVQLIPRIFPWYAPEKYGDVPLVTEDGKRL